VPNTASIEIEFDEETQAYYIVWEPLVISSGNTRQESLEDLRKAAHFAVDTLIDLKLRDIRGNEVRLMAVGRRRYDKPVHFNLKAGFEISSNKRQWDKQDHCIVTPHRVGPGHLPPTCRVLTPRWR